MRARDIIAALPKGKWNGQSGTACCPAHDDQNPSFRATDTEDGTVLLYCYAGCAFKEITDALRFRGLWPDQRDHGSGRRRPNLKVVHSQTPQRDDPSKNAEFALAIWDESKPVKDTLVETYLRSRGIRISLPSSLRYHPGLKHSPTGLLLPAMVAGVQGANGRISGIHRTYLTADGCSKAPVSNNKMMLGSCSGGAVRLSEAAHSIGIAEGIETALSVAQMYPELSVWAALAAGNFTKMHFPPEVREVFVFLDGDTPASKAAESAAQGIWSLESRGLAVRMIRPPKGKDFNDLLLDEVGHG